MTTTEDAEQSFCKICHRFLNNPHDMPASVDCGGDCRQCMAEAGDLQEKRNMGWELDEEEAEELRDQESP